MPKINYYSPMPAIFHSFVPKCFTMRNFRVLLMLVITLVMFSCSKDKSAEKKDDTNTTTYQPATAASTWHYKDNTESNGGFTITATGKDTTIDGHSFSIFDNKPDTSSVLTETYLGKDGNNYYALGLISSLGDNALLYLKDKVAVNTKWSQDIALHIPQMGSVNGKIEFTLAQVNTTTKINGTNFKNVAEVTFDMKITISGAGNISVGSGDMFIARGVGIISLKAQNAGSTVADLSLDAYNVK